MESPDSPSNLQQVNVMLAHLDGKTEGLLERINELEKKFDNLNTQYKLMANQMINP